MYSPTASRSPRARWARARWAPSGELERGPTRGRGNGACGRSVRGYPADSDSIATPAQSFSVASPTVRVTRLRSRSPSLAARASRTAHRPISTRFEHGFAVTERQPPASRTLHLLTLLQQARVVWQCRHAPTSRSATNVARAFRRGVARDTDREGAEEAAQLHRDRYARAEEIYLSEVAPHSVADVIIDNTDLDSPTVVRQSGR